MLTVTVMLLLGGIPGGQHPNDRTVGRLVGQGPGPVNRLSTEGPSGAWSPWPF